MKLFNFVSGKTVDTFAKELAERFSQSCPLHGSTNKNRDFEKQVQLALNELFDRAKAFRREQGLGIFKRARLAKKFQDELVALGYDTELVGRVTTALVASALSAT